MGAFAQPQTAERTNVNLFTAPTVTATPSADAVELSWTAVAGAVRYELLTWWDADIGWQPLGGDSLTGTTYTHTAVTAGVTYYYAVRGKELAVHLRRRGPEPECSDSEFIAISLIGERLGWDVETELLNHMQAHRDKFPILPEQSRFNRRRRNLMGVINEMRRMMLARMELYWDAHCVIDSLPIPVVQFHLAPQARAKWSDWRADYGPVPSKKMMIFGFKLHMLITMGGLIIDFELASANQRDLAIGRELLAEHDNRIVIGDKDYVSKPAAEELWQYNRIRLLTKKRKNQKKQIPARVVRLYDSVRQIIETVTSQLNAQFSIETNHAHTLTGLCARLYTKLTAHTLCIYINRLLGVPDYLQIKQLAFPN